MPVGNCWIERYAISEKEPLAIYRAVHIFYKYPFGRKYTIQTDCQALTILNGKTFKNAILLTWQIFLQDFDFTVQNIRGVDNGLTDYLSRMRVE